MIERDLRIVHLSASACFSIAPPHHRGYDSTWLPYRICIAYYLIYQSSAFFIIQTILVGLKLPY